MKLLCFSTGFRSYPQQHQKTGDDIGKNAILALDHFRLPNAHRPILGAVRQQAIGPEDDAVDLDAVIDGLQLAALVDIP